MLQMAPPCKWKLSSLFSNTQPCTGALLGTLCQKPGFVSCSFSKRAENKGVILKITFSLCTDYLNFFPAIAVSVDVYLSNTDQFRSGWDNPWMFSC